MGVTMTPEERQEIERVLNIGTPLTRRERESFALTILPRLLADYDHLVEVAREVDHQFALGWIGGVWQMSAERIAALNALEDALIDPATPEPER